MSHRRKIKAPESGESRCPICRMKTGKIEEHIRRAHPEEDKQMRAEVMRDILEEKKYSDEEKVDLAVGFIERKEYSLVAEVLKDVDPAFPDMAYVFAYAGQALCACRDLNNGEHYLKRAVAMEPENMEIRCNLAMAYAMNHKPYETEKEVEKVDLAGMLPKDRNNFKKVKALLEKDIEENMRRHGLSREGFLNASRAFNEAHALFRKGEYAGSVRRFEDVLALEPESHQALGNAGVACAGHGISRKQGNI